MLTTYDGTKLTKVTSLYLNDVLAEHTPLFQEALKRKGKASICTVEQRKSLLILALQQHPNACLESIDHP